MAERDRRRAIEGRWLPEPGEDTPSSIDDLPNGLLPVTMYARVLNAGGILNVYTFSSEKEKGMSIYQVFFVHKEDRSLSLEYVVADSRVAAIIKAFAEAKLENIDDYIIKSECLHGL